LAEVATAAGLCQLPPSKKPDYWKNTSANMSKGDLLEMEGVIQDALGGGQYNIRVDQGGAIVRAQLSGRMRRHHIRVLPGDRVRVAVSPYDLSHGLIVYRGK
jgi:translation initiation factor IF-1